MKAYYYRIFEYNSATAMRGEIVLEGIIRHSEDNIYPSQETGIKELPYECEAHHFQAEGYRIEGWDLEFAACHMRDEPESFFLVSTNVTAN